MTICRRMSGQRSFVHQNDGHLSDSGKPLQYFSADHRLA